MHAWLGCGRQTLTLMLVMLVDACKSSVFVANARDLTSFQCYFLLSASPAVPILYYVERLREGRTYTTRSVKAKQQ